MSVLRLRPERAQAELQGADFRVVVEEHGPAVRAFLRRRLADPGRAEDLAQEVFLRAWRHADRYDAERTDVRTWLYAIARNLVIDSYRADGARPRAAGTDELLADVAVPDATEAAVDAWTMADALRALTPAHRDVLVCLYYRRWTVAETAAHLGVPVGTVKSRSTYALRALRLVVEERGTG